MNAGNLSIPLNTYEQAEAFIMEALPMFQRVGKKATGSYSLEGIQSFLEYLGNPHQKFQSIHVAGTNGKGSVAHMLSAVFYQNGYRTGLFSSPHLITYRERIKINGRIVPKEFVLEWVQRHHVYLKKHKLSFFEMSFGLACSYFSKGSLDIAVIEVGLGGRLDATNVVHPLLSIVTNIDFDHQDLLGDTLELIAKEKAGIVKKEVPLLLGNVNPQLYCIFQETVNSLDSSLYLSDESYIKSIKSNSTGNCYHLNPEMFQISPICIDGHAPYHRFNINTVLHAVRIINQTSEFILFDESTKRGIENFQKLSQFRGRFEIVNKDPLIIADAAHNPGGLGLLRPWFKNKTVHLHIVFGLVKGKNLKEIFSILPKSATYYFCAADVPRAMDAYELQSKARDFGLEGKVWTSPKHAINEIILNADEGDMGLVIGSIYLVAEIL